MKLIFGVRPTHVLCLVALVLACTGSAFAGKAISGNQIKNNSLTGKDIKKDSLTGRDIKNDSLKGSDIKESSLTLPAGPKGDQGPRGLPGIDGQDGSDGADAKYLYATVFADATLDDSRSKGVASVARSGSNGGYKITFAESTAGCNAVATATDFGIARIRDISDTDNSVVVNTYIGVDSSHSQNSIEDRGFMVQVSC